MYVAHYIPFRAIRAGHQLSDSKGASAAISTDLEIQKLFLDYLQKPKNLKVLLI